ncbi:MAG TPA: hypothetical protein VF281_02495 [Candidatus Saccharimonadales bacterium]
MYSDMESHFHQDETTNLPAAERPGFYDLQENAEANLVKRGLTRYFTTRNYERSIKWHTRLGSPVIRKVVMGTVGRLISRPGGGGNYRLDSDKSRIEAATSFAFGGSVFNETVHTIAAIPSGVAIVADIAESKYGEGLAINTGGAVLNLALVALQRYNRARMIKRIDEELQNGSTYKSDYENWTGIDNRAVENYEAALAVNEVLDPVQKHFTSPSIATLTDPGTE